MTTATILGVGIALLAACWLATCVRWVPRGQWVVVTRRGGVHRLHASGLAWRLPLVEGFEQDVAEPHDLPLGVRATTRDGVPVLVLAEATVSLPRPVTGTRYADPWPAAERAAEETIARSVTGWSAAELAQSATATRQPLRHAVGAAVDGLGVEILDLELVEVDVQLLEPLDHDVRDRGSG